MIAFIFYIQNLKICIGEYNTTMSCLFDSLSSFIDIDSFTLRNKICDYLENNGPIMENLDTKFLIELDGDNYINKMRRNHEWGSAYEIAAMCNMYNAKIIVNVLRTGKQIEFLSINNDYNKVFYISWTGNHYEPISSLKLT